MTTQHASAPRLRERRPDPVSGAVHAIRCGFHSLFTSAGILAGLGGAAYAMMKRINESP
jgi:hypothetical protein